MINHEAIQQAYHHIRGEIKEARHSNKLRVRREAAKRKMALDERSTEQQLVALPSPFEAPLLEVQSFNSPSLFPVQIISSQDD